MTNEEALKWCRDHSVVAIFHRRHVVLAMPHHQISVTALKEAGFSLEMRDGFAIAMSEMGDSFSDVVESIREAWSKNLSPVDRISEALGNATHIVKLDFKQNMLGAD